MLNSMFRLLVELMILFSGSASAAPSPDRIKELESLVKQDCGSCHGMTLKGGLGPNLLASRLATLPREFLVTTIAKGRPGTPMPPWETLLSADDIGWLVGSEGGRGGE